MRNPYVAGRLIIFYIFFLLLPSLLRFLSASSFLICHFILFKHIIKAKAVPLHAMKALGGEEV
jgi:hypothetical protein